MVPSRLSTQPARTCSPSPGTVARGVPTGGSTGLSGIWKAVDELKPLGFIGPARPRMISMQAEGCAPIGLAVQSGEGSRNRSSGCQGSSILPMGSLYQAAMLIFFDVVSLASARANGPDHDGMRCRHTNLE